jgi:hypothetical protein
MTGRDEHWKPVTLTATVSVEQAGDLARVLADLAASGAAWQTRQTEDYLTALQAKVRARGRAGTSSDHDTRSTATPYRNWRKFRRSSTAPRRSRRPWVILPAAVACNGAPLGLVGPWLPARDHPLGLIRTPAGCCSVADTDPVAWSSPHAKEGQGRQGRACGV